MPSIVSQVYSILGLSALTLALTTASVKAETFPSQESEVTVSDTELFLPETANLAEISVETAPLSLSGNEIALESFLKQELVAIPAPGSVATSAEVLLQPSDAPVNLGEGATVEGEEDTTVAQFSPRRSRPQPSNSYIGVGILTDFDFNEFVIQGKLGIGNNYSIRPTFIPDDFSVLIVPVTYDFNTLQNFTLGTLPVKPYAGAGILWILEDIAGVDQLGFTVTGGVDVPLSEQFTANASVNLLLIDGYASDFVFGLGIGYNFPNLFNR